MKDDNFLNIPDTHWNTLYIHRKLILEALKTMIPLVKGSLLDVGCGTQPYRELFTNITSYTGVDTASSPHLLSSNTKIYDGENLPFPTASFDWVISTEVFEHVRHPDLLFASIFNVLVPGGGFFFTVPFLAGVHEPPNDFRRWTNYGLTNDLQKAGFEKVEVFPLGNWHFAIAFFIRLYCSNIKLPWWTKYWFPRLTWRVTNCIANSKAEVPQTMCVGWFCLAYKST
jgi:SAM-dependent methyltransferase